MPKADVVVETSVRHSFRVDQVAGMFDVPLEEKLRHEWHVELPLEGHDWTIGAIVGPSGSGKTQLGRVLFGRGAYHRGFDWPETALLDAFPAALSGKEITSMLSSVGFASPPSWVKPYAVLSNGERFRVELARLLLDDRPLVVVDEYTSVVDRTVAQIGSAAVAKSLRRLERPKQLVVLSCHYDILEWLAPDWILDLQTGDFQWAHLQRPAIELDVRRVTRKLWPLFAPHHYLSADLSPAAACFAAFLDGRPIAFHAALPSFGHVGIRRASRTVVLPDYQGLGIGNALADVVAEHYRAQGLRYTTVTAHPARIAALAASPRWRITHVYKRGASKHSSNKSWTTSTGRAVVSAEYVGGESV